MNKIQLGFDALGLEDLHNNLLHLNEEGAYDLLPDGLVAEHSTVGPVHSLQTLGQAVLLLVAALIVLGRVLTEEAGRCLATGGRLHKER